MKNRYCPACHLRLAPFDPERVVVGETVLHLACFRKLTQTEKFLLKIGLLPERLVYAQEDAEDWRDCVE